MSPASPNACRTTWCGRLRASCSGHSRERGSVEPAVGRLRNSLSRLSGDQQRRAPEWKVVTQLDAAIAEQLLPELRRVGFDV